MYKFIFIKKINCFGEIIISIEEIDLEFRDSLHFIWIEIKNLVNSTNFDLDSNSLNELHTSKNKKIALDFYNKFKNTHIPIQKIPRWFDSFGTVVILFKDGSGFTIPYFFYQQVKTNSNLDFTDIFNKECSWTDLLSNIFDFTGKIDAKISFADVKILRAFTQYKRSGLFKKLEYSNRNNILIHMKNLSFITGLSEKWVAERFHYLLNNYILVPQYILNPFLFGLSTYLVIYEKSYDTKCLFLDPLTLFNLKIDFDNIVRIIQLPSIDSTEDLNFDFPIIVKKIDDMRIYMNLSGLSSKSNQNFNKLPNFVSINVPISKATINFKSESAQWIKTLEFDVVEKNKYPF